MTKLTDHEAQVLSRLAQGYNQKEVAKQLDSTPQALNHIVNSIRKKHRSLERAISWYMEQNQEQEAKEDEKLDDDEPTGPVQRCETCMAVLSGPGLPVTEHRCLDPNDHIYKQHAGTAIMQLGTHGKYTNNFGRFEPQDSFCTAPVGAWKGKRG